jgi:hypothetical protein
MMLSHPRAALWPPDASELRRVAEAADGLRDRELALVIRTQPGEGSPRLELIPVSEVDRGDLQVCPVRTQSVMRDRPAPFRVTLQLREHDRPLELQLEYDALFWSEAAVEKFFFPYYRRVLRRDMFRRLESAFYEGDEHGRRIVAFGHLVPTIWVPFVGEDALVISERGSPELEVDLLSRWFEANLFRSESASA